MAICKKNWFDLIAMLPVDALFRFMRIIHISTLSGGRLLPPPPLVTAIFPRLRWVEE
ncbi:hypothetical protein ACFO25_03120 [Paenactinomyces guangxiensis]|uniref:Uncharacterized protein n=1 Tax=Paenactinomyces guangxiensis TaxID=1490290 RepID=A0A7W1WTQ1_9BACL|nr:hypothetical protein [Paenactinomyces guangxiensis]MBA4495671.1 hypothetical protein [Paenactinomyces guangxiensis]MBH8592659.1 hypothetical protein [Paenactinomyces guangxiensis]